MNNVKENVLICQGDKEKTLDPRSLLVDSLNKNSLAILFRLIEIGKRFQVICTSHEEIAKKAQCDRKTVLRRLKDLEDAGLVEIIKRGKKDKSHIDKAHIYRLPNKVWGDMKLVKLIAKHPETPYMYVPNNLLSVEYGKIRSDDDLIRYIEMLEKSGIRPNGKNYSKEYLDEKIRRYKKLGIETLVYSSKGELITVNIGKNWLTKKIQEAKKKIKNGVVRKLALGRSKKNVGTQERIRGKEYIYSLPCNYVSEVQQRNKYIQENYIAEKWKVRYSLSEEAVIQVSAFSHSVIAHVENVLTNYRNRIKDPYNFIFKLLLKEANRQGATPEWKAYYNTMEKKGYSTKFDPYNKEKRRMIDAKGLAKRVEKSYDRRIKRTLQEIDELQKKKKFKEAMQKQKEAAKLRREQKDEISKVYDKARKENKQYKANMKPL